MNTDTYDNKHPDVMDFFPKDKVLVELEFTEQNEGSAAKLLRSAIKGEDILPGIRVKRIFSCNATAEDIGNVETRKQISYALQDIIDDVDYLKNNLNKYIYDELAVKDYGIIEKFDKEDYKD